MTHSALMKPDEEPEDEGVAMPGGYPSHTPEPVPEVHQGHAVPMLGFRGGMLPFRVGFAGRGLNRGGFRGTGIGRPFNGGPGTFGPPGTGAGPSQ